MQFLFTHMGEFTFLYVLNYISAPILSASTVAHFLQPCI